MLTSHTPGPWSGSPTGILSGPRWVVSNDPDAGGAIMSEADARLIAAAPDLLDALRGLLGYAEGEACMHEETERLGFIWTRCIACGCRWADDQGGVPEFEWPAEIEAARVAIAKAEGGA